MSLRVVTDSTCDLSPIVVAEREITVMPLFINIDGHGYLDQIDISRAEFYQGLPGYRQAPSTAAPGADIFRQTYDRLAQAGASQVLSIHISESLSATVNVARVAAEQTTSVPVTVLDSRQLSLGTGFLVETAAAAAQQGEGLPGILRKLESQIKRTHVFAALDTLEFLRRSGRMNRAMERLGTLLQLKPLLKMYDGLPSAERVRTTRGAFERLAKLLEACLPLARVAIVHSFAAERAEQLRRHTARLLPTGPIEMVDITPVIGANIGPGAVGFACVTADG
jgi:DegV family protein with EDD domain